MEKREYTCIVCPRSCHGTLTIDDDGTYSSEGFHCKNGEKYAINEYTEPKRVLTTTVVIHGAVYPLLPVVSDDEISRERFSECLEQLYDLKVQAPVKEGDVVLANILGTGVNIIAARTMNKR